MPPPPGGGKIRHEAVAWTPWTPLTPWHWLTKRSTTLTLPHHTNFTLAESPCPQHIYGPVCDRYVMRGSWTIPVSSCQSDISNQCRIKKPLHYRHGRKGAWGGGGFRCARPMLECIATCEGQRVELESSDTGSKFVFFILWEGIDQAVQHEMGSHFSSSIVLVSHLCAWVDQS